jgi:hypothetical protein
MAIEIKHAYTATGTDANNAEVGKTEWNAALSTSMATGRLIGRTTAGAGAFEEISAGSGLSLSGGSLDVNASGTLVLLSGPTSVGTGSTVNVASISGGYARLHIVLEDLSHNNGSATYYTVALSDDNGSTFDLAASQITSGTIIAAEVVSTRVFIEDYAASGTNKQVWCPTGFWQWRSSLMDAVNYVRIGVNAGSFDGGTISIYGERV